MKDNGFKFVFWVAAVPGVLWLTAPLYRRRGQQTQTPVQWMNHVPVPLHVPVSFCCHLVSWCGLSVFSLFYFFLPFLPVLSLFISSYPTLNLFTFLLSTFQPLLSIPAVTLLNKCISHMVGLIRRSFSSAPYGLTVIFHKVFKVIALQQIFVYCR